MAHRQESQLVTFDADGATASLRDDLDSDLRSVAEFTPEQYRLLYIADDVIEEYGSMEAVEDVSDSVYEYLQLDFRERDLFVDLFPPMEGVDGFVTVAEDATIARVLTASEEGLYFSTQPDVPVVPTLRAVADRVARE